MKQIIHKFAQLSCFAWLCFAISANAFAAVAEIGEVKNVVGSLSAKGANGELRQLSVDGKVLMGDMLFTGKDSYARIKFSDGGQISLRPTTQFRIEDYHFDAQQPGKDAAGFSLIKGSLRAVSGLIGKRGDPDSYSVKTREATIGIRGTRYGVLFCKGDCANMPPTADGNPLADGTHLDVLEGSIIVKNSFGSQQLNQGQFGFVGNVSIPPVIVPEDRGVRVEIPAKLLLDKIVRGNGDASNLPAGGAAGGKADDKAKAEAKPKVDDKAKPETKGKADEKAKPEGKDAKPAEKDAKATEKVKADVKPGDKDAKPSEKGKSDGKDVKSEGKTAASAESKAVESKATESKTTESKAAEPKADESKANESGGADSGATDSGSTESAAAPATCPI